MVTLKYKEDIRIIILVEVMARIKVHLYGFIWGIKEYYGIIFLKWQFKVLS